MLRRRSARRITPAKYQRPELGWALISAGIVVTLQCAFIVFKVLTQGTSVFDKMLDRFGLNYVENTKVIRPKQEIRFDDKFYTKVWKTLYNWYKV